MQVDWLGRFGSCGKILHGTNFNMNWAKQQSSKKKRMMMMMTISTSRSGIGSTTAACRRRYIRVNSRRQSRALSVTAL